MQLVSRPADRETLQLGGIQARTLIGGQHSGAAFCIIEAPIGPKTLAGPLHTHRNEDGCWYVMDGEFAAQIGDDEVHEGPGSLILAPRGVAHTYWNPGDSPAQYLELCWPAGLERYLQQVGTIVSRGGDDILDEIVRLGVSSASIWTGNRSTPSPRGTASSSRCSDPSVPVSRVLTHPKQ